ncbi:tetratricopeptide repeat protein 39B-like [Calliphora vicina]|uniref:tetratricopeptide repeat protein 39B-like n=1 Tax=Calliphora vicina TaxID=7373 RepID=UPI00325A924A
MLPSYSNSSPLDTGGHLNSQINASNTDNNNDDDDDNYEFYDAINDMTDDATECVSEVDEVLQYNAPESDSNSSLYDAKPMTLDKAVEEAKLAICYFFNNKFEDARNLMVPHAHSSMYHAMGRAVFSFLEAILTFEQHHIIKAGEELRKCLDVCQKQRRKVTITQSIGKKFKRVNYSHLSDTEAHAELCTAEALLLRALLTFIEDETLSSLIRGGMKIRHCYSSYKECALILSNRKWESDISRIHFESGVRMGMGTFNLMISLLPAGVVKVLEFIGFSGNKESGLEDLQTGYNLPGLRQVLCAMTLLGYHLIVCYVLSHQEGDLKFANEILNSQLVLYPQGVWFLFFKGRLEFMKGNLEEATVWYKKSWKSQNVWPQFHHLSFWELLWVNCLRLDWREASLYASYLVENSKWSRTIYSFQKAAVMLMLPSLTTTEKLSIDNLMRDCPAYKQRIAGKSLPMEKFICKKSDRYFAQGKLLCLPAIELMYLWNTFKVISKQYDIADSIYRVIETKLNELERSKEHSVYDADNKALCLLLRGACLRQMKKPGLALQDLNECINLQPDIKEDLYLIAYASVECGLVYADENNIDLAINTLEETKKKYTGFSLESRLHFRIHTALMDLRERRKEK